jgi:hypothetical protein
VFLGGWTRLKEDTLVMRDRRSGFPAPALERGWQSANELLAIGESQVARPARRIYSQIKLAIDVRPHLLVKADLAVPVHPDEAD